MTEGESVTLECQITGHPAPTLQWFREDFRIESSIDFQISYQNGVAQMVIREAFAEDSGRFTCTATNEAGTISTSCYLLVKGSVQQPKKITPFLCILSMANIYYNKKKIILHLLLLFQCRRKLRAEMKRL